MAYQAPEAVPLLPGAQQQHKAQTKRSKLLTVCPFILGNEFCERLAYYGLATNLVTYLTHIMGVDAAAAAIQVMVFEGTCYITPLLGAYLADSHWGRYKTILVFSTIYLLGCLLLTATSGLPGLTPGPYDDATWVQQAALFGALGVIALGTGGIKPNVSAFGADQFDEKDPQDKREKESFFNWFYLAINIGSLIACTVIVYVQDQVSWTLGFALPASAMAMAVLLFLAGSRHYRHVAPTESPMARVVKVVAAALHNRWRSRSHSRKAATASNTLTPQQQQQQQQHKPAWGGLPAAAAVGVPPAAASGAAAGVAPGPPTQPLLISSSPAGLPRGSSPTNLSSSISSSAGQRVSFYQRAAASSPQPHQIVYGFSPDFSHQQQQQQGQGQYNPLLLQQQQWGDSSIAGLSSSFGGSSSLSRPPRPQGGSLSPTPHLQMQQQQFGVGAAGSGASAVASRAVGGISSGIGIGGSSSRSSGGGIGGSSSSGGVGGVGRRTGSFGWLEDAIVEWQTAQGQLPPPSAAAAAAVGGSQGGSGVVVGGLSSSMRPTAAVGAGSAAGGSSVGGAANGVSTGRAGGYSPKQVEEVKMVLRLLPVFFTTVIYWLIYGQMGTFFIQQGSLMDNAVPLPAWLGGGEGSGVSLHIPAATMALFNTGAIILLVPLYDTLLEPAIRAAGFKWTLLRRIGWGMVVAVLAMAYAAVVERWRLDIYASMTGSNSSSSSSFGSSGGGEDPSGGGGGYGPSVVPLSIMWQAPAYMLVGASEVLASVAQLEFFYDQAPDVMRSCSMALQLLSTAVGSYLGGGLVAAVAAASSAAGHPWLPKDLNCGRLDLFLWLCGGLMAANTVLFVLVANRYEYKAVEHVVWVQVPDAAADEEEQQLLQPPGAAPSPSRRAGTAIAISTSAARRSQYHYATREEGSGDEGELYSRSLAFVPQSPALPAPFR